MASAALITGAAVMGHRWLHRRTEPPHILAYLDKQLTPAASAANSAKAVATSAAGTLSRNDIFWSVMWPYMYTIGRAEGTVGNSYGINPNQVIYTFDSFSSYADHPRRAHPILDGAFCITPRNVAIQIETNETHQYLKPHSADTEYDAYPV